MHEIPIWAFTEPTQASLLLQPDTYQEREERRPGLSVWYRRERPAVQEQQAAAVLSLPRLHRLSPHKTRVPVF